jgi:L-asparaginase
MQQTLASPAFGATVSAESLGGDMTVCIIHTGGTIAMRAGPNGLEPAAGVLEMGLAAHGGPPCDIVQLDPLIDSANARFADWNRIATVIVARQAHCRGFVVTHGTDTLSYTAAALSFCLTGLPCPVIVTGSMLPLGARGTDALRNLGDALEAAISAPAGVWVQFAGHLLHGAKVRKAHSHALDAFTASPCARPALRHGPLAHLPYGSPEIAVLSMAPNASVRALTAALAVCDGAVLRVFGAGTIPNDPALASALMAAHARGAVMIAVSQSPEGGVTLGTYAAGAALARAGVVDGGQITESAAYAKLAHALAHGGRDVLNADICGEML